MCLFSGWLGARGIAKKGEGEGDRGDRRSA